ncbi:single-stranded DNA-binding protein [Actinomadura kijaniata]|uniref:single-stranded DNA-binding protein n=1 Tax=Actinomadura kijaniata TaxID=46161 RepID=UPI000834177B|nr:single-stranded DNA-binding protein [Actinomadura kijaniata]
MANIIMGYLAADPKLGYTDGGTAFAEVVIIRDRGRWVGSNWVAETGANAKVRHELTAWGDLGINIAAGFKSGERVIAVVHDLHPKAWVTGQGQARIALAGKLHELGKLAPKYRKQKPAATKQPAAQQPTTEPGSDAPGAAILAELAAELGMKVTQPTDAQRTVILRALAAKLGMTVPQPAETNAVEVAPAEVAPAEVAPAEVAPAEPAAQPARKRTTRKPAASTKANTTTDQPDQPAKKPTRRTASTAKTTAKTATRTSRATKTA